MFEITRVEGVVADELVPENVPFNIVADGELPALLPKSMQLEWN
ncbi:hypothetical protein OB952_22335 [Aeromonas salmonicida]|nr:hypothetical protein [Aeromonas salmonicida]MDM5070069.1 hypothetical protein [Aeromonas salmonicida]